ncbi:FxSxx-COOH system tetratricopeptide repeat protein [Dactylosporangium matsuzakiense]|uniref:FxSxx-COOH system tetratricopeptide repeat protein n=1 Tax=Dactylosporangium matsuzakiense TaxID=53360 RepID=UPI0021C2F518|nr:FxSxx-COOH system tetratricopeptide repeat protein [Dactylosporangium matsuzakiense]UWZ44639.1 tetratricopeptide repeat protein [Dactylosporangium matsuzakiense]
MIAALGEATAALTPVSIAESLWLAEQLPRPAVVLPTTPPVPPDQAENRPVPPGPRDRPRHRSRDRQAGSIAGRHGGAQMFLPSDNAVVPADTLNTASPAVPALPHALALARALGPLRRAVESTREQEFDEQRTVELIADTRTVQVAFSPSRDRWLDLMLVVDESPSMAVWESTVTELVTLANRINAFDDIRIWRLRLDDPGSKPVLTAGATATPRDPGELVEPDRRQLVLIFSDCISRMWDSSCLNEWLGVWGRSGPVAIVQPLPQRLWHRCRPQLHLISLHPPYAGAPMSAMRPKSRDGTVGIVPGTVPIPVLELTVPWLTTGAALISGRSAGPFNAVGALIGPGGGRLDVEVDPDEWSELETAGGNPFGGMSPAEQVRTFRASASPTARHLAEFLAVAPLTLPVMRLVQRLMLPESLPRDLAEVFLSGLLERRTPEGRSVPADRVLYDFRDNVRAELLTGLRAGEALALLDEISQFVNQRMGTSFDFPALLAGQHPGYTATELGQPFAEVAKEVLTALGGRYALLAEHLVTVTNAEDANEVKSGLNPPGLWHRHIHRGEHVTQRPDDIADGGQPSGASRPTIWGDVPPRNPDFTGREALLRVLRRQLTNRTTALLPHSLHGLGGVGKTQLAVEYAYRYQSEYDLVWWVPAEQPALFRQSLMALARRLELVQPGEVDVARAMNSVYDALRMGRPFIRWLLVLDNANRPEDLAPFLSNPGGHLLITSRNYNWAGIAHTVEVDVFPRAESVELLRKRLPEISEEEAGRLAEILGDLPLALEQAASWMKNTATPFDEYVDLLEKRTVDALREGPLATYDMPVVVVFGLSFDRLADQNAPALQLLELCAFFGAEPISVRLLPMGRYATHLPDVLEDTLRDDIQLRRAVRDIARFGLAKVDNSRNSIQVHRLVQAVLRERLTEEQRETYQSSVQEILAAYNPGDPTDDPKTWDRHSEIGPHVQASAAVLSDDAAIRNVVLDQIRYLYVTGDYVSSRELGQVAYDQWTKKLGADHPMTLVTARFLGNSMRTTGDSVSTRALNERTLAIARRALGEDHEHTLAIANSVGGDLRLAGDWVRSKKVDQDLLARHRRVFGEDDPNTLRVANNLGVDLRLLGDFAKAYELDKDTWERRKRVLGPDHPDTLFTVTTGLSRDLYGLGRYDEAIELQRRWLPVLRERLSLDHANVLLASRIHVASLRKGGQAHEALELARDVVRRRQDNYGDEHAETVSAMLTLFTVLARTGHLADARQLGEETLASYRRVMGSDHVFTYVAMTDLAIVLRLAGDYGRARELDERALAGLSTSPVIGPEHPYTICTAINMSNNLAQARDHRRAAQLLREVYPRAVQIQGTDHPEALACAANLSQDLQAIGETDEARAMRDDTLRRFRRFLKDDHPDIDDLIHGRRLYCVVDPPPT